MRIENQKILELRQNLDMDVIPPNNTLENPKIIINGNMVQ